MKKKLLISGALTTLILGSTVGTTLSQTNNLVVQKNKINNQLFKSNLQMDNSDIVSKIKLLFGLINNNSLTSDAILKLIEGQLKGIGSQIPEIGEYLDLIQNWKEPISSIFRELGIDWEQQVSWGSSPMEAMKNYIHNSPDGDKSQAKRTGSKGEWHYVEVRATNWNWNDFYEYMAGVNFNYMIKTLANGKYLGDLINDNLYLGGANGWGFNSEKFGNELTTALNRLIKSDSAQELLIKAVFPIIKSKILDLQNPTKGVKNLVWGNEDNFTELSLKRFLTKVKYFFETEAGNNELNDIIAGLITGKFAEDIIIDVGMLGYYTLPELLSLANSWPIGDIIGDGVNPKNIAKTIQKPLIDFIKDSGALDLVNQLIDFFESSDAELNVDFAIGAKRIQEVKKWEGFDQAMEMFIDFVRNKNSKYSLKEIVNKLGANPGHKGFKAGSPLFHFQKAIANPNSLLNQLLNTLEGIK